MNIKGKIILSLFIFAAPLALNCADLSEEVTIGEASSSLDNEGSDIPKAYGGEFYSDFIEAAYLEKNGRPQEAFAIYERLYESAKTDKTILYSLASISLALKDSEAMDKYISAYYALAPQEAQAMSLRAGLLWSRGDLKGAAKLYREALSKDPEDPEIITKYVTLISALDSDEAVEYLDLLAKQYPAIGSMIALNIAELYLKQGDSVSAEAYLKKHISSNPYNIEPYTVLANIYEVQGSPAKALKVYLEMEKYGLASADILVKIGAYYVLEEKKDIALQYFKRAKALDNSQASATEFLVLDAISRGDYEAAFKLLTESSAYDSEPSSHIRASYFLSKAGKSAKSAEVLREAYSKFPQDNEIAFYYALSLIDLKDYKQAGEILSALSQKNPDNESILFHYSYVLERRGEYKEMEKTLKRLLDINPENADVLNFYGYYLVDKTRRVEEGGEYIKKALAANPEDAAFIDSMAWYYYKKKEYEKAYELLGSIPLEDMAALNDAEIYLHLGQTAQSLKLWEEAADYYNKVLEIEPNNKTAKKNLKKVTKKIKS